MTDDQIRKLRKDIGAEIKSGSDADELNEWADAYTFSRRDAVEVIRLLLDELEDSRQLLNDGR